MEQTTRHLRAFQSGAAITLVSAALIGLPLLAANDTEVTGLSNAYYAAHIVSLFQKTGAQTAGSFDNDTIDSSGFDFTAYSNHTCSHPTKNDLDACKAEFGPYANLQQTFDSGTLHTILKEVSYLKDAAQFAPAPVQTSRAESSDTMKGNTVQYVTPEESETRDRSVALWQICSRKESTREAALRCYQRNIRRTQAWSKEVLGNVR